MKNYIISITKNNIKRKKHIKNEFKKHNIKYTFFNAITPELNTEILSKYGLNNTKKTLTECELSCFLSHFMIWNKIIEDNIPFAAIFEDDIYLGEDSEKFLTKYNWIPPDIHIIKLEKGWQKTIKTSLFPSMSINDRKLYRLKSEHHGAAGYIISNTGAKYLLEYYKKIDEIIPVDMLIFNKLLNKKNYNVQQLLPAICIQDFILNNGQYINFKSHLEEDRSKNNTNIPKFKSKKSIPYKLKKETFRPFIQLYNFLYKKILTKFVHYR